MLLTGANSASLPSPVLMALYEIIGLVGVGKSGGNPERIARRDRTAVHPADGNPVIVSRQDNDDVLAAAVSPPLIPRERIKEILDRRCDFGVAVEMRIAHAVASISCLLGIDPSLRVTSALMARRGE